MPDIQIIDSQTAQSLVQMALAKAEEKNWNIAVAIADPWGELIAFGRSDETLPEVVDFAIDKAYTAARMRCSTAALFKRAQKKPPLMAGLGNRERLLLFPGGLTIVEDKNIIGAIGISGAEDHEDVDLAEMILKEKGFEHG